jgi:hypothetical protein
VKITTGNCLRSMNKHKQNRLCHLKQMKRNTKNNSPKAPTKTNQAGLKRLKELEAVVHEGKTTFLKVGQALSEIHGDKLYELEGYQSFGKYCAEKYGFSRAHANRLVASANIEVEVNKVMESKNLPAIDTERTLREFTKLSPSDYGPVIDIVAKEIKQKGEDNKTFSHAAIKKAVRERLDKDKPNGQSSKQTANRSLSKQKDKSLPDFDSVVNTIYDRSFRDAALDLASLAREGRIGDVFDWMRKWVRDIVYYLDSCTTNELNQLINNKKPDSEVDKTPVAKATSQSKTEQAVEA